MLRRCSVLLFICVAVLQMPCAAQEATLNLPLSYVTGKAVISFDERGHPENDLRKAGVQFIRVWSADDNEPDSATQLFSTMHYAERGDEIPYDHNYSSTDDFNQIRYNRDHSVATRQNVKHWTEGCGSNTAYRSVRTYTDYLYKNRRLYRETKGYVTDSGKVPVEAAIYSYDKKGRQLSRIITALSGDTALSNQYADNFYYRYNREGRLSAAFRVERGLATMPADSLAALPPDLDRALVSQSPAGQDSLIAHWNASEDADEKEAWDLKDSLDGLVVDRYEACASGVIFFHYNSEGRITSRMLYAGDDLARKDTLMYDAHNRLVRWETDYSNGVAAEDGFPTWDFYYNTRPARTVWTLGYRDDRVATCDFYRYEWNDPYRQDFLMPDNEYHYAFDYGATGSISSFRGLGTRYYRIGQSSPHNARYLVRYEYY